MKHRCLDYSPRKNEYEGIKALPTRINFLEFNLQTTHKTKNMGIIAIAFVLIGLAISLFYGVILLIQAFNKSILWGLGSILLPFVSIIFVIVHWEDAKSPFLKSLLAIPFFIVGSLLSPESFS